MNSDEMGNYEKKAAYLAIIQKEKAYRKRLNPVKTKISQILLYDTEAALTFLIEYNNIMKNIETPGVDIESSITELEKLINEYENELGKEKLAEEEKRAVLQKANDLISNYNILSTDELEQGLSEIKEMYNNLLEDDEFIDRDIIEKSIYFLQIKLIRRKVKEGETNLHKYISEKDELNIVMAMNDEINSIIENPDENTIAIIENIKSSMINKTDIVYDVKMWSLLDLIQNSKVSQRIDEEEKNIEENIEENVEEKDIESEKNSLPAIPKKQKSFSFFDKIFGKKNKIGKKKMKIVKTVKIGKEIINVNELSNIDIEWLANKVENNQLIQIEKKRMTNIEKKTKKVYIPDVKTPIYNAFGELEKKDKQTRIGCYTSQSRKVNIFKILEVTEKNDRNHRYAITIVYGDRDHKETMVVGDIAQKYIKIIDYAEMIDGIAKSDLKQQIYDELGNYNERILGKGRNEISLDELPVFSNLMASYEIVEKEYKDTEKIFRENEEEKRKEFYNIEKNEELLEQDIGINKEKDELERKNIELEKMQKQLTQQINVSKQENILKDKEDNESEDKENIIIDAIDV